MTMQGMITFEYAGSHVVFDPAAKMWNLTEMHQASGSPRQKGPSFWLNGQQAKDLIAALEVRETTGNPCSFVETREGRSGGTWAHWQIAAAYAHYLRPDFYLQWNEWAMERAQQIATGDGAAPLARVAALEARVAALEAAQRGAQQRILRIKTASFSPMAESIIAVLQAHPDGGPLCSREIIAALQDRGHEAPDRLTWLKLRRMAAGGVIVRCGRSLYRLD